MNYEVVVFTCLTLSSMIGAGVLVTPKAILPFGFAATIGWIMASICSLILARIFIEIVLSPKIDSSCGISGIIKSEYGRQQAFIVGFSQWLFVCLGGASITIVYSKYLSDLLAISNPYIQFVMSIAIIAFFNVLYYFTTAAINLLSILAVVKILLFGTTSALGIIDFNFNNFFGIGSESISNNLGTFEAFKYALTNLNGNTLPFSKFLSYVFKSCSIALFAFAGMESAISSSSSIKNPRKTIPIATIIAVVICSGIFVLTHICTVNALGGISESRLPEAPVKAAVEILMSKHFGEYIGLISGTLVSVLAVLGCLGSVMVFCFIPPNCLYDTLSIAIPNLGKRFPKSCTGFSLEAGIVCSFIMSSIIFFYYFVNSNISIILNYSISLLISTYIQCVFVHLKQKKNLVLSFLGIFVCFLFMSGLSLFAIVFGLIVSYIGNIIFILISKPEEDPSVDESVLIPNVKSSPSCKKYYREDDFEKCNENEDEF